MVSVLICVAFFCKLRVRSVGETFAPKAIAGYDFGRERKQDARNKH
mgnify:FL=1